MKKYNYETYVNAMIELLINNNDQTDLGDYVLEYKLDFAEIGGGDMYDGDACLAVAARLKNKNTNRIEWGNIYYKRLIPNMDAVNLKSKSLLANKLNEYPSIELNGKFPEDAIKSLENVYYDIVDNTRNLSSINRR